MNVPGSVTAMLRAAIEAYEKRTAKAKESAVVTSRPGSIRIQEHSTADFPSKVAPRVLEALKDGPNGEKIFKVILISEGPGNRRNKNYYGPESVASAVKAFEGRWCYLNHQAEDEAETLPERRIQDKAGYFKNLGVIQVKEGTACAGELHCDLSESGRMLAEKVASALKYKENFPDNELEYVGFSVNADGDAEPRDMTDKGGSSDDNYVTAITEGDSCDLVTTPARGGRGLAVIKEDKTGAVTPNHTEEGKMKKKLVAILAKFSEAFKSLNDDEKKKLAESHQALVNLAKESEAEGEAEYEAMCAKKEGESDEDHLKRLHGMAKAVAKHLGDKAEVESETEDNPEDDKDKDGAMESKRDGIESLIKESGLPADTYVLADLLKMTYKEAKAIISKDAKLAKSIRESCGVQAVASFHRGIQESDRNNTAAFVEAATEAK